MNGISGSTLENKYAINIRRRALVIDDVPEYAAILSSGFKNRYLISEAHSFDAGISKAENEQPEVIFLDLCLDRGKTGLQMIPRLKIACPNTIIILYSAYASLPEHIEARKIGATEFVSRER